MNQAQANQAAAALIRQGYQAEAIDGAVVVQDPVQCSNGLGRWTEYVPVTLRTLRAVARFEAARA